MSWAQLWSCALKYWWVYTLHARIKASPFNKIHISLRRSRRAQQKLSNRHKFTERAVLQKIIPEAILMASVVDVRELRMFKYFGVWWTQEKMWGAFGFCLDKMMVIGMDWEVNQYNSSNRCIFNNPFWNKWDIERRNPNHKSLRAEIVTQSMNEQKYDFLNAWIYDTKKV